MPPPTAAQASAASASNQPPSPTEGGMEGGRLQALSFSSDMSGGFEGEDAGASDHAQEETPSMPDVGRLYLNQEHHLTCARPTYAAGKHLEKWRPKDRARTVSAVLIMCLNIGVDAPDVVKTSPCAKLECWIDPFSSPPQKSLESIGKALQAQYERLQPRARFKLSLDPTVEEVKKLCTGSRKSSKDDRLLFHYNGHGVPRPTTNGEVWVFNKNFTQYIPLSIYDLQSWMGSPTIFVYDCSAAGNIVASFNQFAEQREREYERMQASNPNSTTQLVQPMRDCIQLAACRASEILPMHPDLPADLFTSCLTTPIEMAVRWFVLQNNLLSRYPIDVFDRIPGKVAERRSPLGELSWIFIIVTDSIAWDVLSKDLFQKLFRQDALVAPLFRSFLLADRIMRSYNCTPISQPSLPPTHQHPLWQAWDLACDQVLGQLDAINKRNVEYVPSTFFSEHLTAFEVWLEQGSDRKRASTQLPVVLQQLLSLANRLRALKLLARFMDLGPWAVSLALSVGLFPYVVKLLQSAAADVRPVIVHIWTKILAVDSSCQADLVKDNGHKYFINILWSHHVSTEERARAAYILAVVARDFRTGQQAVLKGGAMSHCLAQLSESDANLRQWVCLCLAETWANHPEAKWSAIRDSAHEKLRELLIDPVVRVRAAAVYALGRFIGGLERTEVVVSIENTIAIDLFNVMQDASPIVRAELVIALSAIVHQNEAEFRITASQMVEDERRASTRNVTQRLPSRNIISASGNASVFQCLWKILVNLSVDPFPRVAELAQTVVDAIHSSFMQPPPMPSPDKSRRKSKLPGGLDARQLSTSSINEPASPRLGSSASLAFRNTSPLPLSSTYYDWAAEQFAAPSERLDEERPGGATYEGRLWRSQRNERVLTGAREMYAASPVERLDEQVAILETGAAHISLLRFHPYEGRLVVADERDTVSVYNLDDASKTVAFSNKNPPGTRITSMNFINEDDQALLMTGSDEGTVRIWRDYHSRKVDLVTSWRALTDLAPVDSGSGLVTDWHQQNGILLASGDVRIVRAWNAEKELVEQDIPTFSDVSVTCLSSDRVHGNLVIAGCWDGAVRLYDRRVNPRECMVVTMVEHRGYIVTAQYCKSALGELITGSIHGDIKIWDLRKPQSVRTIETQTAPMTALSVHAHAPLMACGSQTGAIKVFTTEGAPLSVMQYHEGFLGQRIGPVSAMAFHPFKVLLASGSTDGIVSIFSNEAPGIAVKGARPA